MKILTAATLTIAGITALSAKPFRPASDSEVVEKLPRAFFATARERASVSGSSSNIFAEASSAALKYIEAYRITSDPRNLGYAQGILKPWWNDQSAPANIVIARAIIKQSLHDFDGALGDLDRLSTAKADRDPQAILLKATILQVQGDYKAAREEAAHLLTIAPRHVAIAALASAASLNGEAAKSYELLSAAFNASLHAPEEEKLWMLTLLGEMATRLGRDADARNHLSGALKLRPNDTYALGALADFLMARNEAAAAFELVKDFSNIDALLLRRALALRAMNPGGADYSEDVADLKSRFAAARLRGDDTHRREEGRFALSIVNQPAAALELAIANWAVQREPADLRLLLEAALAAGKPGAASNALQWIKETRIEDQTLSQLLEKLQ